MRKRVMFSTAAIIVVGFLLAFGIATSFIVSNYNRTFENQLETVLVMMKTQPTEIASNPQGYVDTLSATLKAQGIPVELSVLDSSENAIADSGKDDNSILHIQNQAYDPEVQTAVSTGQIGFAARVDPTHNVEYYHAALPVTYQNTNYFLTASIPTTSLTHAMEWLLLWIAIALIVGALVSALITYFLCRVFVLPLNRLSEAAIRIAKGDFSSRVPENNEGDIVNLAHSFNLMAYSTQHAIDEMQNKKGQLEGVLQGMNDGVLAVDAQNQLLFFNESANRMLSLNHLQTGSVLEGSMLIGKIVALLRQSLTEGQVVSETIGNFISPQNERQFVVYATPVKNETETTALAVISDVTQISKLEQLRSEFVANVTHELKTPLTSIRGSIDLLKSADRDEETRKYFYDVLDIEADRLFHLIDDMLVLSQIESGRPELAETGCDVAEEMRKTIERLAPIAEGAEVTITTKLAEGLLVDCLPTRLQQMFSNLIENAIKYNVPGGLVEISVEESRRMAVIRIHDTGIGIDEEHFGRLFERFYRVDSSRARTIGGTGLGLSIVRHLAILYGGEVGVESKVGEGSTFTVRLPLQFSAK